MSATRIDLIKTASISEQRAYIYQKASNGTGAEKVFLDDDADKDPNSWSPDGKFIIYSAIIPPNYHLWVLSLSGDQKPFPFLKTPFNERSGQFSPDGHWVAYQSDESGKTEVNPFSGAWREMAGLYSRR